MNVVVEVYNFNKCVSITHCGIQEVHEYLSAYNCVSSNLSRIEDTVKRQGFYTFLDDYTHSSIEIHTE